MKKQDHTAQVVWASAVTILVNLLLTVFKLAAGVAAHSGAMLSDAVHSASDVLSTFVVLAGVKFSAKASDREHPYGHERFECVAAILLSVMLGVTGAGIGWAGIRRVIGADGELLIPGRLALVAAVISIVTKEAMYWYTRGVAKRADSCALMADAWHHRSDALSSVGSFVGILGARMGFSVLDPVAGIILCLFVLKAAFDVFLDAILKMIDRACPKELEDEMRQTVLGQEGVLGIDCLHTRWFGDRIYMDLEIVTDGHIPLFQAHETATRVHDAVEAQFPKIKHCMVHVNPEQ